MESDNTIFIKGEIMELFYSKVEPEKLLHIVHRRNDFKNKRNDIIDATQFLQLSSLFLKKNDTFNKHKNIYKKGEDQVIAQESWVVIKGSVKVSMYDLNDELLDEPIINEGDCSVTLYGGHTYTALTDDTLVYEYKTGPYKGVELDKVMI